MFDELPDDADMIGVPVAFNPKHPETLEDCIALWEAMISGGMVMVAFDEATEEAFDANHMLERAEDPGEDPEEA